MLADHFPVGNPDKDLLAITVLMFLIRPWSAYEYFDVIVAFVANLGGYPRRHAALDNLLRHPSTRTRSTHFSTSVWRSTTPSMSPPHVGHSPNAQLLPFIGSPPLSDAPEE
tara:strand:+ start:948 stop:1280 length:333 start_codon:yes stop_codon:yes gene_type:complete